MWIFVSIVFPVISASVNIIDKLIVDRYAQNVLFFVAWAGAGDLLVGLVVLVFVVPGGLDSETMFGGIAAGAVSGIALIILLNALKSGQVSRVVPITHLNPLIVAPLAAVFFDENLNGITVAAIVLSVVGAILVSWQKGPNIGMFGNPAPIVLSAISASVLAISVIMSKQYLGTGHFWEFYSAFRLGLAIGMIWVFMLPDVRLGAFRVIRNSGFLKLFFSIQAIVAVGLAIRFVAIQLGPVSLVTAIFSIQPAMVLLYSGILSIASPANFGHWITGRNLWSQSIGIGIIVSAVAMISLESS